jgi:uncharacterized repeat protein (TIGR03803 family)
MWKCVSAIFAAAISHKALCPKLRKLRGLGAPIPKLALLSALLPLAAASLARAQFTTIYSFTGGTDGGYPYDTPLYVNGALYGTTFAGGTGWGVVFGMTAAGEEKVLYSFGTNPNDGANPYDSVVRDSAGNLYGTTQEGGTDIVGTIFKVTKAGKESILYDFFWQGGVTGFYPTAGLILDTAGNLYGITTGGNNSGGGVVFQLTPTGTLNVLYSFTNGADGGGPDASLIFDSSGNLYGTTGAGGASGVGTVFELSPEPAGGCATGIYTGNGWCETVLYSFTGSADGSQPLASLIFDGSGNLYSTTLGGGASGYGTVFELSPEPATGCPAGSYTGNGWCENALYSFTGGADGAHPVAGLVRETTGNLYGTTEFGGAQPGYAGYGVVFEVTPRGVETVLHTFTGAYPGDGGYPLGGLVQDPKGDLYGTTSAGGYDGNCSTCGYGTVFKVSPPSPTTTVVTSLNDPSFVNQPVTFTATVTSAFTIPDGITVTFYDGKTALGTGSTTSGVATFTTSSLPAETQTITANYPGSAFTKASSGEVTQEVTLYPSTTSLTSSPNPSTSGQAVTLTATVSSAAPGGPTGTVTFKNGTTMLGTATLSAGTATLTTKKLPVGTLTITANYNGDAQSAKSSGTTTQVVD